MCRPELNLDFGVKWQLFATSSNEAFKTPQVAQVKDNDVIAARILGLRTYSAVLCSERSDFD